MNLMDFSKYEVVCDMVHELGVVINSLFIGNNKTKIVWS